VEIRRAVYTINQLCRVRVRSRRCRSGRVERHRTFGHLTLCENDHGRERAVGWRSSREARRALCGHRAFHRLGGRVYAGPGGWIVRCVVDVEDQVAPSAGARCCVRRDARCSLGLRCGVAAVRRQSTRRAGSRDGAYWPSRVRGFGTRSDCAYRRRHNRVCGSRRCKSDRAG
jgi:hypothetical protein